MRGFATGDRRRRGDLQVLHRRRRATATIELNQPFAGFVSALSLPAFSMQSPTALEKYQDDAAGNPTHDGVLHGAPDRHRPVRARLVGARRRRSRSPANDDYWGEKAKIDEVVFVAIDEPKARADRAAERRDRRLRPGRPGRHRSRSRTRGFQIVNRDAVQRALPRHEPDSRSRSTTSGSARRSPTRSTSRRGRRAPRCPRAPRSRRSSSPTVVNGYTDDVTTYDYDPEKAKELLAEAGAEGATIEFNYPTDVSRPYMPSPGGHVQRHPLPARGGRPEDQADRGPVGPGLPGQDPGHANHGIHLLGWTGDYNDTDNFLGVFFGQSRPSGASTTRSSSTR